MASSTGSSGTCPRCGAVRLPGRSVCIQCGMDLNSAAEFIRRRQNQAAQDSRVRMIKLILAAVVVLAVVAGGWWLYSRLTAPGPNPALAYPVSRAKLVRTFFYDISTNDNTRLHQAFELLALSTRKKYQAHEARVWQKMENLNRYLAGIFGPRWINDLVLHVSTASDRPKYVAEIATEQFHVHIVREWPPAGHAAAGAVRHYGILRVRELSLSGGGASQAAQASRDVLGNLIGNKAAANDVSGIHAAFSDADAGKPWQIKQRLLPTVERPRAAGVRQCIYQLWPVRHDPTVRLVLKRIVHNPQYAADLQHAAAGVLSGHVMQATLIANQVTDTH